MNALFYAAMFLVALGPLIVFHELGHFFVARRFGVRVLRFSIGLGRPLFKYQRSPSATEWVVAAIPFGGYVAMLGEDGDDGATYTEEELTHAFNRQSVYRRAAIVAAGPTANFLLAILIYWFIGVYGVMEPRPVLAPPVSGTLAERAGLEDGDEILAVAGEPVRSMNDVRWRLLKIAVEHGRAELSVRHAVGGTTSATLDLSKLSEADIENDFLGHAGLTTQAPPALVDSVELNGVAARAGLLPGDEIVAAAGHATPHLGDFVETVRASPGKPLELSVRRADRMVAVTVVPEAGELEIGGKIQTVGRIGVQLKAPPGVLVRYGPIEALGNAATQTWDFTIFSLRMLGKMIQGEISLKNLSGPVTIAEYAGQSAQHGPIVFLSFLAFISATIGLMNLLPIPVLDGGHLLYHFVEIVRGRPLSERFLQLSQRVGTIVLAGLMGLALFNDFSRLLS